MKRNFISAICLSFLVAACGGGSGGSPTTQPDGPDGISSGPEPDSDQGSGFQLFLGDFLGTGATYRVENSSHTFDDAQRSDLEVTESIAVPGSQIDIIWWTNAEDFEGEELLSYQYDAAVYLSMDNALDAADKELFTLTCDAPMSTNDSNPCAAQGYVRCEYAESNEPTLTCLTVPPQASEGFADLIVDISSYFSIGNPTPVNFITKLCKPSQTTGCIVVSSPMVLY